MFDFTFLEESLGSIHRDFLWIDDPFVGTVFCTKNERGYQTDWWISGRKWEDNTPKLVLRLRASVECQRDELQSRLVHMWKESLQELAFGSAIPGGITNPSQDLKELSERERELLFERHLSGHSQMDHFNTLGRSKVERTANMYLLLKSLGSKQPQKAIAQFESIPFKTEVKPTAINQRLALARQAGFLPIEAEPEATSE